MKTTDRILALAGLAWAILFVSGCGTQIPALVHDGYRKSTEDSAVLRVGRYWIEKGPGQSAVIAGSVSRKTPHGDTSKSRLLVVLRDGAGRELLAEKIGFVPQTMPEEWGPHASGAAFRHAFAHFPANVAEILVKAVD